MSRLIWCFASLLAAENNAYFRTFRLASVAGIFSLFPLLFTPAGKCDNAQMQSVD